MLLKSIGILPPTTTGTSLPYFPKSAVLTFEEIETTLGFASTLNVFVFHLGDKESGMTFHDYRENTMEYVKDVLFDKVEYDSSNLLRLLGSPTSWSLYSKGDDALNTTVASGDVLIELRDTDVSEDEIETFLLGIIVKDGRLPVYMPEWEIFRSHKNTEDMSYMCLVDKE